MPRRHPQHKKRRAVPVLPPKTGHDSQAPANPIEPREPRSRRRRCSAAPRIFGSARPTRRHTEAAAAPNMGTGRPVSAKGGVRLHNRISSSCCCLIRKPCHRRRSSQQDHRPPIERPTAHSFCRRRRRQPQTPPSHVPPRPQLAKKWDRVWRVPSVPRYRPAASANKQSPQA